MARSSPISRWLILTILTPSLLTALGCLQARTGTVMQTYQLNPVAASEQSPRAVFQQIPATLLVSIPKAQAGFGTPRMAYVMRPHELNYFTKNQWVDTPARMFVPPLLAALERSAIWDAVVLMPSIVRGDFRLDLDRFVLQQEFFDTPSHIHLSLRAQLININRQCVMGTTDFDVLQGAPSDDPYGGVLAANKAASKILEQVVVWLSTYMNEGAKRGCTRASQASKQGTSREKT